MKEILFFEIKENIRSRWIFLYAGLLAIALILLSFFGDQNGIRLVVSLMNLILIVVPLFSITFSGLSFLESMPFAEVLLTKSVTRSELFFGKYLGILVSLIIGLLAGVGIPGLFILYSHLFVYIQIIIFGILLSSIFVSISFLIASLFRRGEIVLTASLLVWFYFFIFFDALIFIFSMYLGDYPIEIPSLIIVMLNPIDLIRILIILQTSSSALLGFSGAILMETFGIGGVVSISISFILAWILIPIYVAYRRFLNLNF
ncbi:MAG: ABC transporter permease subunit [Leptospira sp.]|nr:ABC transporter permease subunit [Leptospira sp.]